MKLNNLLLGVLGLTASLSSCNSGENVAEFTSEFLCCNLVVSNDGKANASHSKYRLGFDMTDGELNVATSTLDLGGTENYSFTSSMMKSNTTYGSVDWINGRLDITSFSGGSAKTGQISVSNLKGVTSSVVNIINTNDPKVPGYAFTPYYPLIMSYSVNDQYTVKTFMSDAVYTGTTTIRTVGGANEFSNNGVRYRIVMNSKLNKADVIFYDAKFAEAMPRTIQFVLKDMDLTFNKSGYIITNPNNESVTPYLVDGEEGLTPAPSYQITNFLLSNVSDDLTVANINYTVQIGQAQYLGEFSGFYALTSFPK